MGRPEGVAHRSPGAAEAAARTSAAVVAEAAAAVVATRASIQVTPVAVAVLAQTPETGAAVEMRAVAGMRVA